MKKITGKNLTISSILPTLYNNFRTYTQALKYLHKNGIKYPKNRFLTLWKNYLTPEDDTPIFLYPDRTCQTPDKNGAILDIGRLAKYLWVGKLFYLDKSGYDKIDYIGFITNELLSRIEGEEIFKQAIRKVKESYQMEEVWEFKHTGVYRLVGNEKKDIITS